MWTPWILSWFVNTTALSPQQRWAAESKEKQKQPACDTKQPWKCSENFQHKTNYETNGRSPALVKRNKKIVKSWASNFVAGSIYNKSFPIDKLFGLPKVRFFLTYRQLSNIFLSLINVFISVKCFYLVKKYYFLQHSIWRFFKVSVTQIVSYYLFITVSYLMHIPFSVYCFSSHNHQIQDFSLSKPPKTPIKYKFAFPP